MNEFHFFQDPIYFYAFVGMVTFNFLVNVLSFIGGFKRWLDHVDKKIKIPKNK